MDLSIGRGRLMLGDCLERMRELPDASVDMALCDLPYGTTQNKWDAVIPFEPLWREYWRVAKPGAAVVLTAAQPFTSALVMSQVARFRYAMCWDKKGTTGFQRAKIQPLRRHEDVLVFSSKQPPYFPQMETRGAPRKKGGSKVDNGNFGDLRSTESFNNEYYPTTILEFSNASKAGLFHPTQKPVALFEYLIRTYMDAGMTVLDNCSGSGTTAIAAERTGRNWICIERDPEYFSRSAARIWDEVSHVVEPS